jgi:mannose-6-phosphate isomerase-like protein (cupin superfamily)
MDKDKVFSELRKLYPGKNIIQIPVDLPSEIVCEIDPEKGLAVAIIDSSAEHYHRKTQEHYRILRGDLWIFIDGEEHILSAPDEIIIPPNHYHYALGDETWVEVKSTPPWTP